MGSSKMNSKREVYTNTGYLMKQEIFQTNHLTYHLKELEKEEQENTKVSRRKEIIKTQEKINKIEAIKMEKINKTKGR